jgi:hypothetical protein
MTHGIWIHRCQHFACHSGLAHTHTHTHAHTGRGSHAGRWARSQCYALVMSCCQRRCTQQAAGRPPRHRRTRPLPGWSPLLFSRLIQSVNAYASIIKTGFLLKPFARRSQLSAKNHLGASGRASATCWDWEAKGVMAALLLAVVTAAARSHTHSSPTPPPPAPVDVPPEWRSGVANGDLLFAAVPPSQKVSACV